MVAVLVLVAGGWFYSTQVGLNAAQLRSILQPAGGAERQAVREAGDAPGETEPRREDAPEPEEAEEPEVTMSPGVEGGEVPPAGTDMRDRYELSKVGLLEPEVERGRMELAVLNHVRAVYAYAGDDPGAYARAVGSTVAGQEWYMSPGSDYARTIERKLRDGGSVEAGAVLDGFDVRRAVGEEGVVERVEGTARFRVADEVGWAEDNSGAELSGDVRAYEQGVTLVPAGATYRVLETGELREAG